jgi:hypothetical protein
MTQEDYPTDFRALCAELVDAYAWCVDNYMTALADEDSLVQRARAALAQPEPEEPTDEELNDVYWEAAATHPIRKNSAIHTAALRAVLARWGK